MDSNDTEKMQAVPIDELLTRATLPVDVYVLLPTGRHLMIGKQGTPSEPVKRYKERNVDSLWVKASDYQAFIQFSITEAANIVNAEGVSSAARVEGLRNAMAAVHHEVQTLGFDEQIFSHAKAVNTATLTMLSKSPRLVDLMAKLGELNKDAARHSMSVSVIASMLGVAQGWVKPGTIEKLSLGGFLHDIGKARIPADIASKSMSELTGDDLVIYKSHPEIGAQLLSQAKTVPDDVILIVRQHHELADGSGFPSGMRDVVTSPLARVVALADAFVNMVDQDPKRMTAEKARECVEIMLLQRAHLFNRDAVKALHRLFPQADRKAAG